MSEMELYGLMAVAKEQQAATQRAAEALEHARKAFQADREAISEKASQAAQEAARAHLAQMVEGLQLATADARQALAEATTEVQAVARGVSMAWLFAMFGLGFCAGGLAVWLMVSGQLNRIEAMGHATWEQTQAKPTQGEK
jgi:hypothetical protein